jgi:hypothetical protein
MVEKIGGLPKAFMNADGTEQDGKAFETAYEAMLCRFKNAYDGVPGDDIEFALAAEAAGQTVLLNAILSRQIHAADFRDEPF